ncbi:HypC/HybG/HupF family hydrogenase formation chaperone [Mesorhizobium sp. J8]|uniref:HypC/HybG/HupF family hydrogenase formation chaperone n=1 Tax=Mesorhizobium sp. J8 TaxID=2777475 RepID=UPI00191556D3|nr:HypC/HybG/HupF family hydrogenase formation chaperone [Mesorhizobium sp. J8]BCM17537.1 HypC/HybG/HupF family hydrogenase formation chaperone [Mesorhizobium sp. J8]
MCLAVPARVVELLDNDMAVIAFDTLRKRISLAFVEDVAIGDFVLVHVGYALHKVSVEEAERTLKMMAQAGVLQKELEAISA